MSERVSRVKKGIQYAISYTNISHSHIFRVHQEEDRDFVEEEVDREEAVVVIVEEAVNIEEEIVEEEEVDMLHLLLHQHLSIHPPQKDLKKKQF